MPEKKTSESAEKVRKTLNKKQFKVTCHITTGPVSPAQKMAWDKYWQKMIAEAKQSEEKLNLREVTDGCEKPPTLPDSSAENG